MYFGHVLLKKAFYLKPLLPFQLVFMLKNGFSETFQWAYICTRIFSSNLWAASSFQHFIRCCSEMVGKWIEWNEHLCIRADFKEDEGKKIYFKKEFHEWRKETLSLYHDASHMHKESRGFTRHIFINLSCMLQMKMEKCAEEKQSITYTRTNICFKLYLLLSALNISMQAKLPVKCLVNLCLSNRCNWRYKWFIFNVGWIYVAEHVFFLVFSIFPYPKIEIDLFLNIEILPRHPTNNIQISYLK